jgi:hypothetical protein
VSSTALVLKRIRFVDQVPAGAKVRREFKQPRHCYAIEDEVALADVPARPVWPEPTEHLLVAFVPRSNEGPKLVASWLAAPDHPEAVPAVELRRKGQVIYWRPGRVLVQGRVEDADALLAALTDFAYYEGELRSLEETLEQCEQGTEEDAARAHRIRDEEQEHWARFGEMIEYLYVMRLTFARLEPRLAKGSRTLPPEARRVMTRLLARADVEERAEAFSDRLEACEDLYEGANDRVADYRWYRGGHRLELGILLLLSVEVILLLLDLYVNLYVN